MMCMRVRSMALFKQLGLKSNSLLGGREENRGLLPKSKGICEMPGQLHFQQPLLSLQGRPTTICHRRGPISRPALTHDSTQFPM